jgi:hypothetical protein
LSGACYYPLDVSHEDNFREQLSGHRISMGSANCRNPGLCGAIVAVVRGFLAWQLRGTEIAYWATLIEKPAQLELKVAADNNLPQELNAQEILEIRISAPAVLNIPCGLLGLLRREAVPRGFLPEFWRSLSWPFFGIGCWWIAG